MFSHLEGSFRFNEPHTRIHTIVAAKLKTIHTQQIRKHSRALIHAALTQAQHARISQASGTRTRSEEFALYDTQHVIRLCVGMCGAALLCKFTRIRCLSSSSLLMPMQTHAKCSCRYRSIAMSLCRLHVRCVVMLCCCFALSSFA